jgi:hypothetical protein
MFCFCQVFFIIILHPLHLQNGSADSGIKIYPYRTAICDAIYVRCDAIKILHRSRLRCKNYCSPSYLLLLFKSCHYPIDQTLRHAVYFKPDMHGELMLPCVKSELSVSMHENQNAMQY